MDAACLLGLIPAVGSILGAFKCGIWKGKSWELGSILFLAPW